MEKYEKKYKEVLERAKNIYGASESKDILSTLTTIFPELKESEDDKIRKKIINTLNRDKILTEDEAYDCVKWLEKQGEMKSKKEVDNLHNYLYGEQKSVDKVESKFKVGDWITNEEYVLQIDEVKTEDYLLIDSEGTLFAEEIAKIDSEFHLWTIQDARDGDVLFGSEWGVILMFRGIGNTEWDDVIDYHCYYNNRRKDFMVQEDVEYWGNTKNHQLKPATKEQRDLLFQKMKEAGYIFDFDKKELKKIGPKFKVGDWIVWKDKNYKVNYNGCGYELFDQNGLSTSWAYKTIEDDAHLWTIQYAKDGDVLVASDGSIFIFKEVDDDVRSCKHYIALTADKVIKVNVGLKHFWETSRAVHPATKEQRDLLFQKMYEAGYEWDVEKKELNKIEPKPDIEMITPEESLGIDSETYNKIVDECIYGGQNHSWSEDDEKALYDALWCCKQATKIAKDENDMGNIWYAVKWLTSLKDRVQPQPKQEWSEDDESTIKDIIEDLEYAERKGYVLKNNTFLKEIYWLNSLKERLKGKNEKVMTEEEKELLLKDLEWCDMETNECHCYNCKLFDSKNNVCKCIDLCKRPKSTFKGFYKKY